MQTAGILVDPELPPREEEGTLVPISEANFFDLNRVGGFVMICVHTFLWRHQMQLNSFRVSLRRFRDRPLLGGSWLRDLFPYGKHVEIVPAPSPGSLRHFIVWEDTHTYRFSFFVSFRRHWQTWQGSFLEEAEVGQLARVRVEDLFDRGTHGCICSEEPCKVVAPVHAEFGDTLLIEQGTHLYAACFPEQRSSAESSISDADGISVCSLCRVLLTDCLQQLYALSLQQSYQIWMGWPHIRTLEKSAELSSRDLADDVSSSFQQSPDLPFWLHYVPLSADPPPVVMGKEALMVS